MKFLDNIYKKYLDLELPFENRIFEYSFVKSVKSDIRISKLHSNFIGDSNLKITFESPGDSNLKSSNLRGGSLKKQFEPFNFSGEQILNDFISVAQQILS